MNAAGNENSAKPLLEPLTRREQEILELLAEGLTSTEIAERLTLAVSSVRWYVQEIYGKLGVNGKRQAITRAGELGLIPQAPSNTASSVGPNLPAPRHLEPLPTGTVTFLFTDIEGSTPLWEQHPTQMTGALKVHNAVLREAVEANGGRVYKVVGDAFQAAFATALPALKAAVEGQLALQAASWNELGEIRVRMGLHTGDAELDPGGDEYAVSHSKNRVARIMSAAHGGQVLLSQAVADLTRLELPSGVSLKDLGEHHLKGLSIPEHLYQVLASGLAASFPPLSSLDSLPNNLPLQLTSFIGREKELAEVRRLLSDGTARLVTLTGSGGTGKTRLALQAAAELVQTFADGAWLVELAPITDAEMVAEAAARVLDVRETPGRSHTEAVCDFLQGKHLLLILDNCEHVVLASAQFVYAVLQASPGLRILATSREVLGVEGETAYRVPSLPAPGAGEHPDLQALAQFDAVRLFVERAQAASAGFELNEANAAAVAEISRRLDGIPLALELAAARMRLLSAGQIAVRLNDAFRLLTGGSRTVLPRHQTLRAMIDWSYNLLSAEERRMLRELAVFAGGWTLEAAEAVCGEGDVLGLLGQLVDKSLVISSGGEEPRLHLLETIRQYAREKLSAEEGEDAARKRHLAYFLALAERIEPELRSKEKFTRLNQMVKELDNLRLALGYALEADLEAELRLASAMMWFRMPYMRWDEGAAWLEQGLFRPAAADVSPGVRAKALAACGRVHVCQRKNDLGKVRMEESLRACREMGQAGKQGAALALAWIGDIETSSGNLFLAETYLQEALALYQEVSDPINLSACLMALSENQWQMEQGSPKARRWAEECLALQHELDDVDGIAISNYRLGAMSLKDLDLPSAKAFFEESVTINQQLGETEMILQPMIGLGDIALMEGNTALAQSYFQKAVDIQRPTDTQFVDISFLSLGDFFLVSGKYELARGCFGEAKTFAEKSGSSFNIGWAQYQLAKLAWLEGDQALARNTFAEALGHLRDSLELYMNTTCQIRWGSLVCQGGDPEEAASYILEGIRYFGQTRHWADMAVGVDGLARLAAAGHPERAVRLFGIAERMNPYLVNLLYPLERDGREAALVQVRQAVGEEQMAASWAEGKSMPLEQAIALALEDPE